MSDFTIFPSKLLVESIEAYSKTVSHSVRFGGGLPYRPNPDLPPDKPADNESRHLRQLLDVCGDYLGIHFPDSIFPDSRNQFKRDYLRQHECLYYVESLKNFTRDTVPTGISDQLQDETPYGVIDVCEDFHDSGFERMKAAIK